MLSANGKEFVERLGVETTRRVILGILCYMEQKLKSVPILDFLGPTTMNQVQVVKEESQPYWLDTYDDDVDEDI